MALTLQQNQFVDFLFENDFNSTKAADLAGYKHPNMQGPRLLKNKFVMAEIARRQEKLAEKHEITMDWLVKRLVAIADANFAAILVKLQDNDYDLNYLTEEEQYAITELTEDVYWEGRGDAAEMVKRFRAKMPDRLRALELLGKTIGAFADRTITDDAVDYEERLNRGRERARLKRQNHPTDEDTVH